MLLLRKLFEEFLIAYWSDLFVVAADYFKESVVVVIEPVVGVAEEATEIVLIDLVDIYVEFQVGQVEEDLLILLDGPGMNIEVVSDMRVARRGIDNRNTESSIFNADCTVNGEGEVDAVFDYPMVAGLRRQKSEFRKSLDESLDDFDIAGQEIGVCFYVPIVVGSF